MVILNLILSLIFLAILVKSVDYAIKHASRLAKLMKFPEFLVSFFVIALISVLPEATIAIISAINGEPGMSLGTLLGSNLVDLTFVFGVVALFSSRGIDVKSKILENNFFYLILLLFPLILGSDGNLSRRDGIILIAFGILFFVKIYFESRRFRKKYEHNPGNSKIKNKNKHSPIKDLTWLILSLVVLLIAASFTVKFSVAFAHEIKIPAILIGITILAVGTCLPELVFSIKAVKENKDSLALGDILGTVVTDATIILGIVALISPFNYNTYNLYVTGGAMFLGGFLAMFFMKSEKSINKIEGLLLILFYIAFVFVEFFVNKVI